MELEIRSWELGGLTSIGHDKIHLWTASLIQPFSTTANLKTCLSLDEIKRANRFRFDDIRQKFIVGHGVLRFILARYLNISPPDIIFHYGKFGKPYLDSTCNTIGLQFNLAHSHEMIVFGIILGHRIGVDLEYIRPVEHKASISKQFFSMKEYTVWQLLPDEEKTVGFFNCWTRKEAYIKAIGKGFSYPLDKFAVSLRPNEPAKLEWVHDSSDEVNRWAMQPFSLADKYIGVVVVEV